MREHINLIRKIAWSFHRTTGIEWKELFSQACLAYLEAMRSYDSCKGAKTTWAFHGIQNNMINFCKRERRDKNPKGIERWFDDLMHETAYGNGYDESSPARNNILQSNRVSTFTPEYEFFQGVKKLSKDTEEILEMVMKDPIRYALPPRKAVGQIRKDLREIKEWSWPKIEAGMRNLRTELS